MNQDIIKDPSLKGKMNKNCNRTACQEAPATYYNHSTEAWYCAHCADTINRMNPESYQMFGHQLCTHLDTHYTREALSK